MNVASSTRSADVPKVVFDHRHAVEGFVRGILEHGRIQFSARWPFDRDTGEDIYVATRVAVSEYAACCGFFSVTRPLSFDSSTAARRSSYSRYTRDAVLVWGFSSALDGVAQSAMRDSRWAA